MFITANLPHCPTPISGAGTFLKREHDEISLSILQGDPPFEHHPTRAGNGEQVAVPRWRGGVGGQAVVGAVGMEEVGEVGQESPVLLTSIRQPMHPR